MKKILIALFALLVLVSCGKEATSLVNMETKEFVGNGFVMQIPKEWNTENTTNELPSSQWRPVLGAIDPQKHYNFSNNILIIEDILSQIGSSKQYSEKNNQQTQKKYFSYKNIESGAIIFPDGDESTYYVFDANYNNQVQKLRFIQTAKICGTKLYHMHISLALNTDFSDYINLFKTFECK